MTTLFTLAGLNASDYTVVRSADQSLIYDAITAYVGQVNEQTRIARTVFVQEQTTKFKERYQLPGGGYMSQRAPGTRGNLVRASGSWDVAYPIYDYTEEMAMEQVEAAYMTPQELDRHVQTIVARYVNRDRGDLLKALMLSSNATYNDERNGALTVVRLANADGTLYPPKLGTVDDLASHSHYFGTNYTTASISNTNDPVVTAVEHLAEHFGDSNGHDIVFFAGTAVCDKLATLTAFKDVPDQYIRSGTNTDVPVGMPTVPGMVIGRHTKGAWITQWREVPADYFIAVHLDAPAPLKRRVDPPETKLPGELTPVFREEAKPIETLDWQARFGYGVANRLSAVVGQCVASTLYTAPSFSF